MANALHYVPNQDAFLEALVAVMEEPRLLLIEYHTATANRWVPFPVSQDIFARRLANAGLRSGQIHLGWPLSDIPARRALCDPRDGGIAVSSVATFNKIAMPVRTV